MKISCLHLFVEAIVHGGSARSQQVPTCNQLMKSSSFTWVTCQSSAMFHSICSNSYNVSGYEFPGILGTTTSWKKKTSLNFAIYSGHAIHFHLLWYLDISGFFSPSPSTRFQASSPGSKPIALLPRIKPRLAPQQQRKKITKKSLEEQGILIFQEQYTIGIIGYLL